MVEVNINTVEGAKALVVDHYFDNADLIRFILSTEGIESAIATSVSEALQLHQSLQPDILIAELFMPVEDGYQLIHQLRQFNAAEGGRIPAIALTTYSLPQIEREATQAGYQDIVSKPIDADVLLTAVTHLLRIVSHTEDQLTLPITRLKLSPL